MNFADNVPAIDDDRLDGWKMEALDFPSFRMSLLVKVMDRLTIRELAGVTDLPIAEWRVLSRLALYKGGLTVRQIAMKAWVDRAEVSRAASSLEARGFLARRNNPADRRAPILFATAAGRQEYDRLLPIRAEFHRGLTEDMSQAERDAFDTLLGLVARKLGKLADE